MEHLWILMSWLINAVCGIAAFIYRKNSEKTAIIILIEKLLIKILFFNSSNLSEFSENIFKWNKLKLYGLSLLNLFKIKLHNNVIFNRYCLPK